ncbi:hypothetical protein AB0395_22070 [Streptosporangium sp. NPDC051023]|uniref:hypothetical protein n=1 Tax=Streptosporangium sp. NPDC051023 TaxID=3155410 RepID=UPI00344E604A
MPRPVLRPIDGTRILIDCDNGFHSATYHPDRERQPDYSLDVGHGTAPHLAVADLLRNLYDTHPELFTLED